VSFFLRSMISTASHTMEYAGSGTDYRALPENGGAPIEANEAISRNNGKVWLTSTDQSGKFKVGDTFVVDQQTGFVNLDPTSYGVNIVSDLTPELGGDLDVLARNIYSSVGDIGIQDAFNTGVNLLLVRELSLPTAYPIVTQFDIGTDPNQVPLNGYLGSMAFQDAASVSIGTASIDQAAIGSTAITAFSNVPLLTGGGIKFPATQVASADPNTLDDYEEGTWTVTFHDAVSAGNQSSTTATGTYTKVGRFVHIQFAVNNVSTAGLTSTNTLFFSLPFAGLGSPFEEYNGACAIAGATVASTPSAAHLVSSAARGYFLLNNTAGATFGNFPISGITSGANGLRVSLSYMA